MKTIYYSNTGLSSWQIGINAEVLSTLIEERGDDVYIVTCDNVLNNCFFNQVHNPIGCALCQSRQQKVYDIIGISRDNIIPLKKGLNNEFNHYFETIDDLLAYEYEGFNIGRGVASSIISYTRKLQISSKEYHSLIQFEIDKSINVLENFKLLVESVNPKEIYIFNGRFAEAWPIYELAKSRGIDLFTIESGSPKRYELFKNSLPHSIAYRHIEINRLWSEANKHSREQEGQIWFENRRKRTNTYEPIFTLNQQLNSLPTSFDISEKNIVFFNSSEDELKAIQEWKTDLYDCQNEAIEKIVTHFSNYQNIKFYLRVHPNLGTVSNDQINEISQFNFKNLTILNPFDEIDSYALAEAADLVITFGSSMGIEATYWGTPSILLGNAFYRDLDVTYNPNSYQDLFQLIMTDNLAPKPKNNTLLYGYYFMKYGKATKYFDFKGIRNSRFKNQKVGVFNWSLFKYLILYSSSIRLWNKMISTFGKRWSIKLILTFNLKSK